MFFSVALRVFVSCVAQYLGFVAQNQLHAFSAEAGQSGSRLINQVRGCLARL